jgi:hypothetical protein
MRSGEQSPLQPPMMGRPDGQGKEKARCPTPSVRGRG